MNDMVKIVAALLVWALSVAYGVGSFKAEVQALRRDVQRMEGRLKSIDDYLRGRTIYEAPAP